LSPAEALILGVRPSVLDDFVLFKPCVGDFFIEEFIFDDVKEELDVDLVIPGFVFERFEIDPDTDLAKFDLERLLVRSRFTEDDAVNVRFLKFVSCRSEFRLWISSLDVESHFLRVVSGLGLGIRDPGPMVTLVLIC